MNKQISHTFVLYQDCKLYGNHLRTYPIFVDILWLYVLQVEERTTSVVGFVTTRRVAPGRVETP